MGTLPWGSPTQYQLFVLFRALLRPIKGPSSSPEDSARMEAGAEAVRMGAKACCIEAIDFVMPLQRNVWDVKSRICNGLVTDRKVANYLTVI